MYLLLMLGRILARGGERERRMLELLEDIYIQNSSITHKGRARERARSASRE